MIFRKHGVQRLPEGGLRVTLSAEERRALAALPEQLEPIVTGEADAEALAHLRDRLFPSASEDPELDREYRELAHDDLVEGRLDALREFASTLQGGRTAGGTWTVELAPDAAHAWLAVVNDARLVLAGVCGIASEEEWEHGPDPADPASMLLWYLGWLEEQLVTALMRGLPDP